MSIKKCLVSFRSPTPATVHLTSLEGSQVLNAALALYVQHAQQHGADMDEQPTQRENSPVLPLATAVFDLWLLPLQFWSSWLSKLASKPPSHRLTPKEVEDKEHAQLVVPEPLKTGDDRELFA